MHFLKKVLYFSLFFSSYVASGQDTLKLTIEQADSMFLKNNFFLLAATLNIEAQKAQVIQAKVYPNPVFTATLNAYDPDNNKAFHVGKTGDKSFQIEQLILLGGKRKSEIELAKINTAIAELEFQQLLQQLKYRLHTELIAIGQQQILLNQYNKQLDILSNLLNAYQTQVEKENIPLKEIVRLKGAYLELNNYRAELLKEYLNLQANLKTILQTNADVMFVASDEAIEKYIHVKDIKELLIVAKQNRPDFLIAEQNKLLAQQNVLLQKRLAVPDISFFAAYDQRGGAFTNQINVGFSLPLPLWNRNQGNIKTAKYQIQAQEYTIQAAELEMQNEIHNAYTLYTHTIAEYQKIKAIYSNDFVTILNAMTENFQKRNVSIIEFLDFFESFNNAQSEVARIKIQLATSAEQLNLLTGKDVF